MEDASVGSGGGHGAVGVEIADVECGHIPPYLPLVDGAHGRIIHTSTRHELVQTLN